MDRWEHRFDWLGRWLCCNIGVDLPVPNGFGSHACRTAVLCLVQRLAISLLDQGRKYLGSTVLGHCSWAHSPKTRSDLLGEQGTLKCG